MRRRRSGCSTSTEWHDASGASLMALCGARRRPWTGFFHSAPEQHRFRAALCRSGRAQLPSFRISHPSFAATGANVPALVDRLHEQVFGSAIQLSQRLEPMCPRWWIAWHSDLASKLTEQVFGSAIQLSQRLEPMCPRWWIAWHSDLASKLTEQAIGKAAASSAGLRSRVALPVRLLFHLTQ
ncbi:unnamed protein product [Effrenium voratum]|uniref:Uncharacterized protein n=1 Tax=Effrenium voratum TaxID=2562239 RepID=A0AA36HYE7_9DINO|nr:unnamed protein product [Effrenium voratum]